MHEIWTNPLGRQSIRKWPRLTPSTSLCTVVLLGLGGWVHFSGRSSDDAPAAAAQKANHVLPREEFAVSTIQNEIDETTGGRVTTASA